MAHRYVSEENRPNVGAVAIVQALHAALESVAQAGFDVVGEVTIHEAQIPLVWVGGAHAYHQHHSTDVPPWQHLDDILRNGRYIAKRWAQWPVTEWLSAFEAADAIKSVGDGWVRA